MLKKAKHEREFANATRRLGNRHKDYFNLEEQHEEDLEAAFAERKDFESQISTLNNELSQCKGRLTTVNTKILDRETQLASALKAKEELESKLEATTQRADENALNLGELILADEHSTMIGRTPAAPVSNVARWWYYLKTPRSGLLHIMRTRFGIGIFTLRGFFDGSVIASLLRRHCRCSTCRLPLACGGCCAPFPSFSGPES